MTRKEYVEKYYPTYINDNDDGGVYGCPYEYHGMEILDTVCTLECNGQSSYNCEECWNKEFEDKIK